MTAQMHASTARGFEPLRAEPNGFRVHLLSRSNPCGQSPMDFESISLAARTHGLNAYISRSMYGELQMRLVAHTVNRPIASPLQIHRMCGGVQWHTVFRWAPSTACSALSSWAGSPCMHVKCVTDTHYVGGFGRGLLRSYDSRVLGPTGRSSFNVDFPCPLRNPPFPPAMH